MTETKPYLPKNKIRIVTAASLFDGHDAAINIMRRIIQSTGVEVIHLGHNRSVHEVVDCAIQENANAIAITSYQGGHLEYLKYMYDLLQDRGGEEVKIFAGGGGTILPSEIKELMDYGITKVYHSDDGRAMGLQGMINELVQLSDFPTGEKIYFDTENYSNLDFQTLSNLISAAENFSVKHQAIFEKIQKLAQTKTIPVLGITGTGGAGKSSLVDEFIRRFVSDFPNKKLGILSVDPSKRKTGGALLGDRIRMNAINHPHIFMRSLATRQANLALSKHISQALDVLKIASFDLIILETSGIGQSDTEILEFSDLSLYVMTPEYGASTQLEKIDMLDFADFVALNKSDKKGAQDALRDIQKQYQRNHQLFENNLGDMPIYETVASQFNNEGINQLYKALITDLALKFVGDFTKENLVFYSNYTESTTIIPPQRVRYLSEIAETNRVYDQWGIKQAEIANNLQALVETKNLITSGDGQALIIIDQLIDQYKLELNPNYWNLLNQWEEKKSRYKQDAFTYVVRNKEITIQTKSLSLSRTAIPKVCVPNYHAWGDILRWSLQENVPGEFPYTAGIYPFKRETEDPTRMFAGEGNPERTNKRFHYVSFNMPAKRLSTAFDSVTLYGNDPHERPDIYGKIGNAGVSIATLDDAKKLYSGFHLADSNTSVSMTINGPAPMMLGFFMNAAIDQQCELYIMTHHLEHLVEKKLKEKFDDRNIPRPCYEGEIPQGNDGLGLLLLGITGDDILDEQTYGEIKKATITVVRGTIQADILKEDQAQNTCIFSTEFALRLMGDIQAYFIIHKVRNFYSVSISGYHIAEAGANPITQLAFTLANGFTYVEYYLSRGMSIDEFAPNLSFFFSNGIDPEYAVIGRVARRIWAKALKLKYQANTRAQMLKYHIQTSGRSLHAQEISFNDIRTTLQALYAIYDNCNSLHTNAYDEAITTPTEESVRRAMAIQLIINKELGLAKNENPMQGSFIIEELTDLVEDAVYKEFDRITERGGVLGAMETMYQRSKIQEESLYYEKLKHSNHYPIIGVNTFLDKQGSPTIIPKEIIRSTEREKQIQISSVRNFQEANETNAILSLDALQQAALKGGNLFETLMQTTKYASLGQITNTFFKVGGQYRRNM